MYDQVTGRDIKYDDIKFLGLEYERLSLLLLDRHVRSDLSPVTQACIKDAFTQKRLEILMFDRSVGRAATEAFVAMIKDSNHVNTFEQLDSALHTFLDAHRITPEVRKKLLSVRLGVVTVVNMLYRQQQIDETQREIFNS